MMKTLLIACAVSVLSTVLVRAQGTVTFVNDASTLVVTNDLAGHVGAASADNGTRVALYYSISPVPPPINPFPLGWTLSSPTAAYLVGTPTAGRFSGGTQTFGSAAGGDSVWVMVRGWTGGYSDWASAYAAASGPGGSSIFVGTTTAWLQTTGDPNGAPPFGNAPVPMMLGPGGFNGLVLAPLVPEPSAYALCGLGAVAACYFTWRRKKA